MRLSLLYINNLHKLHTNVFRLHPSSPNFHSCCYFFSQTLSLSSFLPSVNVCNPVLGHVILLGVDIQFPWVHPPISWDQDVSRSLKELNHGLPYGSHISSIPENVFGCDHLSFGLQIFLHYYSSKIHLLSLLMDMKDSSWIVFFNLHILGIYDQIHHRWSILMCDS